MGESIQRIQHYDLKRQVTAIYEVRTLKHVLSTVAISCCSSKFIMKGKIQFSSLSLSLSLTEKRETERERENRLKLGNKRKEKAIKEALYVLQKQGSCTPAGIRSICEETYKKQYYMTTWTFILTELVSVPGQKEYIFTYTV
ncbi:hypothetical protein ACJW31_08G136500 [Castanea mollissima]